MKILINYANDKYIRAQQYSTKYAYKRGKVDKVIEYGPKDIDANFRETYAHIFKQSRGDGYWLWKPYLILKSLNELNEGDYLCYMDSGAVLRKPLDVFIACMERDNQDIMLFELPFIEKTYTKRDAFIALDCDEPTIFNTPMRIATYVILKKSKISIEFAQKFLEAATIDEIITDEQNHLGFDNYEGFVENRHDQSILSLISKKMKIPVYRDPSQFGMPKGLISYLRTANEYKTNSKSNYSTIICLHRSQTHFRINQIIIWLHWLFPRMYTSIVKNVLWLLRKIYIFMKRKLRGNP